MSYENPDVPHEVNVGREDPLVDFLRLLAGIGLVVVAVTVVLYFTAGWLARLVPFATERSWVGDRVLGLEVAPSSSPDLAAIQAEKANGAAIPHRPLRPWRTAKGWLPRPVLYQTSKVSEPSSQISPF